MSEAATTTRPARKRTGAPAAKKAAPAKAAPKSAATPEPDEESTQRFRFELEKLDDTKNYAVFQPPKSSGCVGKIYVPLGTQRVLAGLIGPKDN